MFQVESGRRMLRFGVDSAAFSVNVAVSVSDMELCTKVAPHTPFDWYNRVQCSAFIFCTSGEKKQGGILARVRKQVW